MKLVKIFIAFVIVSAVIGIGSAFTTNLNEDKIDDYSKETKLSNDKYDSIEDSDCDSEDKIIVEEKTEEIRKDTNKTVTNKSNNSNTSTEKNNTNNNVQSNTNQKNKNTVSNNQQSQEVSKPVEPVKKPIWEQLGMTENHYYNEPMYSWERVDFASSKYGSETITKKACLEYGDKYEPYLNGEVSFNCSTVTSTSGKYLGEMFYTEKIN